MDRRAEVMGGEDETRFLIGVLNELNRFLKCF